MGRIFCSIVDDSVGWHDTVCGNLRDANMKQQWSAKTYQQAHNDWNISGEQSFLVELAKYGMGRTDLAANLNLFTRVSVDAAGTLVYSSRQSRAGDTIDLRFEMDTLVLFHTCPHPLNDADEYPKRAVRYQLTQADQVAEDDFCMNSCPENRRGFDNNRIYHLGGHCD
jgi:urea carboxylase-associated protein 2